MQTKLFEVRDSMTLIPVMATLLRVSHPAENYLLRRAGFSPDSCQVSLTRLADGDMTTSYDAFFWANSKNSNRTLFNAHRHIEDNWEKLNTGDVIDVQFLLGETKEPKKSERALDVGAGSTATTSTAAIDRLSPST